MILTIVRHGETEWNSAGKIMGQLDIGLNARGRLQAKRVARRLADAHFDVIVTSDLARAVATAREIAGFHEGVQFGADSRFRERKFGVLEGLTREQFHVHYPEVTAVLDRDPLNGQIPGGETKAEHAARVNNALRDLINRYAGRRVLLVTHGGVLARIREYLEAEGCPIDGDAPQTNTCVTVVDFSTRPPGLLVECDASHIDDLEAADDGRLPE